MTARSKKIASSCLFILFLLAFEGLALIFDPKSSSSTTETCVLESLYAGQRVRAAFYPLQWERTRVRAWVSTLDGRKRLETAKGPAAELVFQAPDDGDYCFCWVAEPPAASVRFGISAPHFPELEALLKKGQLKRFERSVLTLAQTLEDLKYRAQHALHEDLRTKGKLRQSMRRLRIMTLVEMMVLFGTLGWRVWRVKSMFRERYRGTAR